MIRLPAGRREPLGTRRRLFRLSRLLGSAAAALSLTAGSAWAEELAVVATIKPVHALVAQVMPIVSHALAPCTVSIVASIGP